MRVGERGAGGGSVLADWRVGTAAAAAAAAARGVDELHVRVPIPNGIGTVAVRRVGVGLGVPQDVIAVERDVVLGAEPAHERGRCLVLLLRGEQRPAAGARDVLDAD